MKDDKAMELLHQLSLEERSSLLCYLLGYFEENNHVMDVFILEAEEIIGGRENGRT